MDKLLERLWAYVAKTNSPTMETRMFRLITLSTAFLCLAVVLPSNLLQNLPMSVNLLLITFGAITILCYRASLRGRDHPTVFMLAIMALVTPAWFFNGGSQGSVPYYFFAAVLIPMVFWRGHMRWVMLGALVVNMVGVVVVEYFFPKLVIPFERPVDRIVDLTTGVVSCCGMLTAIAWVFIENYHWEHKQIQGYAKVLTASEKNYREVVENVKNIIIRVDSAGRITFFNKFAENLFGYSRNEVAGKHVIGTIVPPVSSKGQNMMALVNQFIAKPQTHTHVEHENVCRSGERLKVSWTNQPIYDEQGHLTELLCVGTDITEKSKMFEQMQLTQASMDAVADPIIWLKPDGQIIYANNAFERLTSHLPRGIQALRLHDILNDSPPLDWEKRWTQLIQDGVMSFEANLVNSDRTICPLELSLTHMNIRGNEYATVILHNMTEWHQAEHRRQQHEHQMLQLQKLESLGVMAGGIAHDFNNLLTGIMANISLAKFSIPKDSEDEQLLQEAEKAALQAKELTLQLLTFSKGGKPIKRTVSVEKIARECSQLALRGGTATCCLNFPDGLWSVDADPAQLAQVINNLLINAKQSMPNGGHITLEAQNTELAAANDTLLPEGRYVQISIHDKGVGIAPEVLPKIFDPYFTTKKTGSGLGLAVVHSILKNHQGNIQAKSQPGKGTTFIFWLPATRATNAETNNLKRKPTMPQTSPPKQPRVLIMDDEQTVRTPMGKILQRLGCTVTMTEDGKAAVETYRTAFAEGQGFDLVIMDLTVPGGMGGQEAIQHLRQINPNIKAIVSSGYSSNPVMAEFQQYGFIGVITKPFTMEQFVEAVTPFLQT